MVAGRREECSLKWPHYGDRKQELERKLIRNIREQRRKAESGINIKVVVETVITDHSNNVPWVPQLGGARIQLTIHMLQVEFSNFVIDVH